LPAQTLVGLSRCGGMRDEPNTGLAHESFSKQSVLVLVLWQKIHVSFTFVGIRRK